MTGPLAPVLTMIETGQARQFAYLHAAVYAGQTWVLMLIAIKH